MTNTETGTLVLKDQAGGYILLSRDTLEKCRVPEEHKAQIEQLITEQQDVQGHLLGLLHLVPVAVIITGGILIYQEATKGPIVPPTVTLPPPF